jgi:hypothetical protein
MKILGIHWNPGNPIEILGIRRKSGEYNYNLKNPKNLRNTSKIPGIRNPLFPPWQRKNFLLVYNSI